MRFGQPIQCQRILFYVGVFRRFRRGKGPFLAGRVRSLSCGVRGLSRASTGLCARVCVSFPECPGTPRVKRFQTDRLFSMGGEPIWAGKRKTTSHFFYLKIGGFLRGRRATFPFPAERTRDRQSARNYCSPNASRTACTPPAFPPRFPARNTRKTTPCRDRPRPPRSLFSAPEQQAFPGEVARPGLPPGARPGV